MAEPGPPIGVSGLGLVGEDDLRTRNDDAGLVSGGDLDAAAMAGAQLALDLREELEGSVASIADAVSVRVLLARIGDRRAIVRGVRNPVPVDVDRARAEVEADEAPDVALLVLTAQRDVAVREGRLLEGLGGAW